MPFDIPTHLDFDVEFEDTKVSDKKYVINGNTGQYLGIVGNGFTCAHVEKIGQPTRTYLYVIEWLKQC